MADEDSSATSTIAGVIDVDGSPENVSSISIAIGIGWRRCFSRVS
ncbi:hypothetical protein [Rhodopirellula baltica]